MSPKYLILFFSFALAACSTASKTEEDTSAATAAPETQTAQTTTQAKTVAPPPMQDDNGKACESLHALKKGEIKADRDGRVAFANRMTNAETDEIADTLYAKIAKTGQQAARPLSAVQPELETMCRAFASNMENGKRWLRASAACLYPRCVNITMRKLSDKK